MNPKPLATFGLLSLTLHFGWEMAQADWFESMEGLSAWTATLLCLRASLGDLAITALAYGAAAGVAGRVIWALGSSAVPAAVFVTSGLAITAAYEVLAVSTGRWRYAEAMPTLGGIGVLPLLQWLVVPLAVVLVFRSMERHVDARAG